MTEVLVLIPPAPLRLPSRRTEPPRLAVHTASYLCRVWAACPQQETMPAEPHRLKLSRRLGFGSFGSTYLGTYDGTQVRFPAAGPTRSTCSCDRHVLLSPAQQTVPPFRVPPKLWRRSPSKSAPAPHPAPSSCSSGRPATWRRAGMGEQGRWWPCESPPSPCSQMSRSTWPCHQACAARERSPPAHPMQTNLRLPERFIRPPGGQGHSPTGACHTGPEITPLSPRAPAVTAPHTPLRPPVPPPPTPAPQDRRRLHLAGQAAAQQQAGPPGRVHGRALGLSHGIHEGTW